MVSLLYKPHKQHILKLQITKAFRPPTFVEMYALNPGAMGNSSLHPETINTLEFQYIYKTTPFTAKAMTFYSLIDNLIIIEKNAYLNKTDGASSKGAELELEFRPLDKLTLDGNISYAYTHDNQTGKELTEATRWLGNVGVTYQLTSIMYLNLQDRYVGPTARGTTSTAAPLKGYNVINMTLSAENILAKCVTIRAGIKNIFDSDVRTMSSIGYSEDYRQPGRQWWISLYKKFD
ncbi:TonB-dependent receptor [Candidatus Magnetobacterium bavaricum]|uniref:TonB-dependent receptor n=1 Tax=Candidatus Magnetobacterium bavaricum TaxID=29290 RepID=A0A0F3GPZ0_9BACT|nr:TonB-dependent receptor [Candidatus Magnetobacterium bavaricum]